MALADYKLNYTKKWTSAADFPTYENREEQVRADLQLLFDEMQTAFNAFIDALAAGLVPFTSSDAVPENNVQAAIENVQQQAAAASAGSIPERSLDGNKLKLKAITASEVDDGAIGKTQMATGSVDNTILAADAVRASHVKDGELTLDKFASGALDEKADLVNGIIARMQRRWRVDINPAGNSSFTLAVDNAETALVLSNSTALTITIPAHSDVEIPVGSSILVARSGTADVTVAPATGVTLQYPPNGTGSFTIGKVYSLVVLLKTANNTWAAVALPGLLGDGDVTHAKLAADAVEAGNIKDGEVVDGKLGANSVNGSNIKSGAVSAEFEATIPATVEVEGEDESAWSPDGPPYTQTVEVSGLVPVDPNDSSTTVTWTCNSADADVLAAYALLSLAADTDSVLVSASNEVAVDIPVIATQNSVPYTFTIPAADYIPTGTPYKQDVSVVGLLATDKPIVDIVPSAVMSTAEAQLEAYGAMFKMVAGADTLTVYASDKTQTDVSVHIKAVRK